MNSRHPDPRRVLGRCRAAVRGPDPGESGGSAGSGDEIIFARFRHKNNKNENAISKLSVLLCFLARDLDESPEVFSCWDSVLFNPIAASSKSGINVLVSLSQIP